MDRKKRATIGPIFGLRYNYAGNPNLVSCSSSQSSTSSSSSSSSSISSDMSSVSSYDETKHILNEMIQKFYLIVLGWDPGSWYAGDRGGLTFKISRKWLIEEADEGLAVGLVRSKNYLGIPVILDRNQTIPVIAYNTLREDQEVPSEPTSDCP